MYPENTSDSESSYRDISSFEDFINQYNLGPVMPAMPESMEQYTSQTVQSNVTDHPDDNFRWESTYYSQATDTTTTGIQTAMYLARSFSPARLVKILIIIIVISAGMIAVGITQINDNQKSFQTATSSNGIPTGWVSFSNQTGNFTLMFPTTPQVGAQVDKVTAQGMSYTLHEFVSQNAHTAYSVVYAHYPNSFSLSPNEATLVLNLGLQQQLSKLKDGNLSYSRNITVDGWPAIDYAMTGVLSGHYVYQDNRIIIANHTIYGIYASNQGKTQAPNYQYFFNSFKLGY